MNKCRICNQDDEIRNAIEKELVGGKPYREVSKQFINFFKCDLHSLEQSIAKHYKKHLSSNIQTNNLSNEEVDLLKRFREGSVDFEEASRIIATKVLEKILQNPGTVQVRDWLQSELIRIKKQELDAKNNYAMELINRLFAGNLPPQNCPQCGHEVIKIEAHT